MPFRPPRRFFQENEWFLVKIKRKLIISWKFIKFLHFLIIPQRFQPDKMRFVGHSSSSSSTHTTIKTRRQEELASFHSYVRDSSFWGDRHSFFLLRSSFCLLAWNSKNRSVDTWISRWLGLVASCSSTGFDFIFRSAESKAFLLPVSERVKRSRVCCRFRFLQNKHNVL